MADINVRSSLGRTRSSGPAAGELPALQLDRYDTGQLDALLNRRRGITTHLSGANTGRAPFNFNGRIVPGDMLSNWAGAANAQAGLVNPGMLGYFGGGGGGGGFQAIGPAPTPRPMDVQYIPPAGPSQASMYQPANMQESQLQALLDAQAEDERQRRATEQRMNEARFTYADRL